MTTRAIVLLFLMLSLCVSCSKKKTLPSQEPPVAVVQEHQAGVKGVGQEEGGEEAPPRRIILFVGDGMGVAALTAAAYVKGHKEPLEMMQMPWVGLMRTHEHEFVTTDSAASATALATGHKTHFEGVSVRAGTLKAQEMDVSRHLETLVAAAKRAGLRTGLVATSRIVHATPAAFAAHRTNRNSYEDIAQDVSKAGVDVLLGAGSQFFGEREDGQDLLAQMEGQGYRVALDVPTLRKEVEGGAKKLVGLVYKKDMPPLLKGARTISLAQLTDAAITVLDRENPKGFFLMVEGSQIDWEEHAMNAEGAILETLDFDQAVGVARRYGKGRDDTLVVATADHETGGLSVLDDDAAKAHIGQFSTQEEMDRRTQADPTVGVSWPPSMQAHRLGTPFGTQKMMTTFGYLSMASRALWKDRKESFSATHTATMVPLMAQGKWADKVVHVQDNADLGRLLRGMILAGEKTLEPETRAMLTKAQGVYKEAGSPKNVIVLVGDGMGVSTVTAGYYALGGLSMLSMPHTALVTTHGASRLTNDSAATATALATGFRTEYGVLGMRPGEGGGLVSTPTVIEAAEGRGLGTGIVTTTTVTHATPGAFVSHLPGREDEGAVASHLVGLAGRIEGSDGVDVVMGGGRAYFGDKEQAALKAQGVEVSTRVKEAAVGEGPMWVLLDEYAPEGAKDRLGKGGESLGEMTAKALEKLGTKEKGFFLMVEGGQIDWALHALDKGDGLIPEVKEFDEAVGVALAYAREHGDTLVLVTADHDHTMSVLDNHYGFSKGECGIAKRCGGSEEMQVIPIAKNLARGEGLVANKKGELPGMILQYAWPMQSVMRETGAPLPGTHTAHMVPLFAAGPGAMKFGGFMGQDDVGRWLIKWARGEGK